MILNNPYYNEYMQFNDLTDRSLADSESFFASLTRSHEGRDRLVKRYAWGVPDQKAIEVIAAHTSKIVEVGAGTGYWAYLLSQLGVSVHCYDTAPYYNAQAASSWHTVRLGGPGIVKRYPDRALMLLWPPYNDSMAYVALKLYAGDTVIYVGEGEGGCTADDDFHHALEAEWDEVANVPLNQWSAIHSIHYRLSIYRRKV